MSDWTTNAVDSVEAAADLRDRAHALRDIGEQDPVGSADIRIVGYEIAAAIHCLAAAIERKQEP